MKNIKDQRTHDNFYINENRYDKPKDMFKFIVDLAFDKNDYNKNLKIADIGCANGEYLYYLNKILPNSKLEGIDLLPNLIEKAKNKLPNINFINGSVLDNNFMKNLSYDKIFLTGVHSIFDEFEICFNNLIDACKEGGEIYITGMFNPFPLDVIIKYKKSDDYENDIYESGWNIFSQESVSNFLKNNGKVNSFSFKKFEINTELKRQDDPVRSWTLKDFKNDKFIVNGLCIIQPHYTLKIKLN